ncbi:MAG: SRPBCC family protein [Minicystis sp.]
MNRSIVRVAGLAVAITLPGKAFAGRAPATDLAVAEGRAGTPADDPKVESFAVRGSSLERVRATVAVGAPIDRVRSVVFDFARYPEFMPGYTKASVLRTTPAGGRSVRMDIEQLGGAVHLWMRLDISPPEGGSGVEAYEGRLVEGNVKAFRTRWELEALKPDRTRLTIESFVDPDLALVPSSLINRGARDGIRDAVLALKARAEGRRREAR